MLPLLPLLSPLLLLLLLRLLLLPLLLLRHLLLLLHLLQSKLLFPCRAGVLPARQFFSSLFLPLFPRNRSNAIYAMISSSALAARVRSAVL